MILIHSQNSIFAQVIFYDCSELSMTDPSTSRKMRAIVSSPFTPLFGDAKTPTKTRHQHDTLN